MKKLIIIILLYCLSVNVHAQISTDERPPSFDNPLIARLLQEQQTDLKSMPRLDMTSIQAEDREDEQNGVPPRFGFPHDVAFNLNNSGVWTTLPNGDSIWQLSIHCPGALSINLLYDRFHLSEGAKLFIYTPDKKHHIGAFTAVNNKGSDNEPGGFATGLLYGETITLEYYLPKDVQDRGTVSIARVVHGYRYITILNAFGQALTSSGNCQVDVNCPEGANWQQEKNAVALILVNGIRDCTGSLINTTCNDDRPLLLTANHCLAGADAITNPNLAHWSFYWHYESPICGGHYDGPNLSTSGATVIANNGNTDFALLQLIEDPRNRNGVTPYYLGWDRSGNAGTGGVGIHHPSGDIKKIATYTGTPTNSICMNFFYNGVYMPNHNFWQTGFIATTSGHSIMEPGSSGSSLINSDRHVIGQLYGPGIRALCPEHLCGNNPSQQRVSYGKFSVSWTGDGAIDSRRRLHDWLDPLGIAGNTWDGKAAAVITGPDDLCTSDTYTLTNLPAGATVTGWSATPSTLVSISGSGSSVTISRNIPYRGFVTLLATVNTACGAMTIQRQIRVGTLTPGCISYTYNFPPNQTTLFIEPVPGATSYQWYVNGILQPTYTSNLVSIPNMGLIDCDSYNEFQVFAVSPCGLSYESYLHHYVDCDEPWGYYCDP